MSDITTRLAMLMMLGQTYKEMFIGLTVNSETKIKIGDEETRYKGPEIKGIKLGSVITGGVTKDDEKFFEVISVDMDKNEMELEPVELFKAKLGDGRHVSEVCVVSKDRTRAFEILREHCKERGYKSIVSVSPTKKIFEPVLK
jgi:hypothetical protein